MPDTYSTETYFTLKGPKLKYHQTSSLGKHLLECLSKHGHSVAQCDPISGETKTFSEIKSQSIHVAKELRKRNIRQNDIISVCSYNNINVCLPVLASLYIGAIVAPLDPTSYRHDIRHLLKLLKPKLIFCDQICIEKIRKSLEELNLSIELVIFQDTKTHTPFNNFLENEDTEELIVLDFSSPYDYIGLIMPTSGITDLPKLVSISHGNLMHQIQSQWDNDWKHFKLINISTLSTITGIKTMFNCINHGVLNILSPKFDTELLLQIISKQVGNIGLILGTAYYREIILHANVKKYNLSTVKLMIVHGDKISENHLSKGEHIFSNANICYGYGLTEASGLVCSIFDKKLSVGRPEPDTEIKIIDNANRVVGTKVHGQICIRGPRIMTGYYNDSMATLKTIDSNGWLYTGDTGYYDEDKCLYIDRRLEDDVKHKQFKISSSELELLLLDHPEIRAAIVLGLKNEANTFITGRVLIVRKSVKKMTEQDINAYIKVKTNVKFHIEIVTRYIENLPITSSGKIDRRAVMKMFTLYYK